MQNALPQYVQDQTYSVATMQNTSSTASLRQFRKKELHVEKGEVALTAGEGVVIPPLPPSGGLQQNSSHVARVAPHAHYPAPHHHKQQQQNDYFRYAPPYAPAYTAGTVGEYGSPFKERTVKYSEIAEITPHPHHAHTRHQAPPPPTHHYQHLTHHPPHHSQHPHLHQMGAVKIQNGGAGHLPGGLVPTAAPIAKEKTMTGAEFMTAGSADIQQQYNYQNYHYQHHHEFPSYHHQYLHKEPQVHFYKAPESQYIPKNNIPASYQRIEDGANHYHQEFYQKGRSYYDHAPQAAPPTYGYNYPASCNYYRPHSQITRYHSPPPPPPPPPRRPTYSQHYQQQQQQRRGEYYMGSGAKQQYLQQAPPSIENGNQTPPPSHNLNHAPHHRHQVSSNIRQYLENWAEEEGENTGRSLKNPIEGDEEIYVINASELPQYLENGVPILTSEYIFKSNVSIDGAVSLHILDARENYDKNLEKIQRIQDANPENSSKIQEDVADDNSLLGSAAHISATNNPRIVEQNPTKSPSNQETEIAKSNVENPRMNIEEDEEEDLDKIVEDTLDNLEDLSLEIMDLSKNRKLVEDEELVENEKKIEQVKNMPLLIDEIEEVNDELKKLEGGDGEKSRAKLESRRKSRIFSVDDIINRIGSTSNSEKKVQESVTEDTKDNPKETRDYSSITNETKENQKEEETAEKSEKPEKLKEHRNAQIVEENEEEQESKNVGDSQNFESFAANINETLEVQQETEKETMKISEGCTSDDRLGSQEEAEQIQGEISKINSTDLTNIETPLNMSSSQNSQHFIKDDSESEMNIETKVSEECNARSFENPDESVKNYIEFQNKSENGPGERLDESMRSSIQPEEGSRIETMQNSQVPSNVSEESILEDSAENISESFEKPAENRKEFVEEPAENMIESIEYPAENMRECIEDPAEDMKESAGDVRESLEEPARNLRESIEDPAENIKESAGNVKESLAESTRNLRESIEEPAENLTESLEDPAENLKESLEEPAENLKESIEVPLGKSMEEPAENLTESPENMEESLKEPPENMEESIEVPLDESIEGPVDNLEEVPAENLEEAPAENLEEAPAENLKEAAAESPEGSIEDPVHDPEYPVQNLQQFTEAPIENLEKTTEMTENIEHLDTSKNDIQAPLQTSPGPSEITEEFMEVTKNLEVLVDDSNNDLEAPLKSIEESVVDVPENFEPVEVIETIEGPIDVPLSNEEVPVENLEQTQQILSEDLGESSSKNLEKLNDLLDLERKLEEIVGESSSIIPEENQTECEEEIEYRSVIKIEDSSVLLEIGGELVELSVNILNGKKVIQVSSISSTNSVVDQNDNLEDFKSLEDDLDLDDSSSMPVLEEEISDTRNLDEEESAMPILIKMVEDSKDELVCENEVIIGGDESLEEEIDLDLKQIEENNVKTKAAKKSFENLEEQEGAKKKNYRRIKVTSEAEEPKKKRCKEKKNDESKKALRELVEKRRLKKEKLSKVVEEKPKEIEENLKKKLSFQEYKKRKPNTNPKIIEKKTKIEEKPQKKSIYEKCLENSKDPRRRVEIPQEIATTAASSKCHPPIIPPLTPTNVVQTQLFDQKSSNFFPLPQKKKVKFNDNVQINEIHTTETKEKKRKTEEHFCEVSSSSDLCLNDWEDEESAVNEPPIKEDDKKSIDYKAEVGLKLNDLSIEIPQKKKIKNDVLMKKFLRKEQLNREEIKEIRKIIFLKKKFDQISKKKKKRFRNLYTEDDSEEDLPQFSVTKEENFKGVKLIFKRKIFNLQPIVKLKRCDDLVGTI